MTYIDFASTIAEVPFDVLADLLVDHYHVVQDGNFILGYKAGMLRIKIHNNPTGFMSCQECGYNYIVYGFHSREKCLTAKESQLIRAVFEQAGLVRSWMDIVI